MSVRITSCLPFLLLSCFGKKKRIREVRIINLKAGRGFPSGSWVKSPPVMQETQETWVQSVGQKISQRKWQATPVFLPGEFHG